MDEKFQLIAKIRLVDDNEIDQDGARTLSVKVEKINVVLDGDIIGEDPDVKIEILSVE